MAFPLGGRVLSGSVISCEANFTPLWEGLVCAGIPVALYFGKAVEDCK